MVFIKKLKSISQLDHYELNNFKNSHETNEKDECNSTENLHSKEDCNKSCNKTKQTTLLEKYYNLRREHRINMLGEWSINNANNIDNTSPPSLFDSTDSDVLGKRSIPDANDASRYHQRNNLWSMKCNLFVNRA